MIKGLILGLFCFFLFLLVHIIVFRTCKLEERFHALTNIFLVICVVYGFLYYFIPPEPFSVVPMEPKNPRISIELVLFLFKLLNFGSGFLLYIFLFMGYCQFYFIVDRSISVRVMIEIEKSPDKKLTFEEIQKVYCFNEILSRRLGHMVEGSYVKNESGYFVNTTKGYWQAKLFGFLKEILRLGSGG